ncbi:hypothetical protein J1G36_11530 [Pseudomonas carnis]|uniref:hypothetical protein n=1 Tax=Pseudomonas TaxID=286 RepID=UPI000F58DE2D|nr:MULTISPECIES: hypothetical protein [Pseudomonas]AZC90207.1 hypothetical protein C4K29_3908 [Pseudomonas chlororaphis subsp. piscium]MBY8952525.1 hypothetical protein [Pseudomonas carnis]
MRWSNLNYLRPVGRGVVWALGLVVATLLINVLAIRLLGDVQAWSDWLRDHTLGLLLWRLCLYAALIYGWRWLRARLLQREPDATARLRRAECAAVAALVLLEVSNALSGPEAI